MILWWVCSCSTVNCALSDCMVLKQKVQIMHFRFYSSKVDWKKIRPMILERIRSRARDYPVKSMVPVAEDVLEARQLLIMGVSTLLKVIPVRSCRFCPEVFIGDRGHEIKTCPGFKQIVKDCKHKWIDGNINDILVPVEAFHLQTMFQKVIKHEQRFDFDRVPAVLELCYQAGAKVPDNILYDHYAIPDGLMGIKPKEMNQIASNMEMSQIASNVEMSRIASNTISAWERFRLGVQKLLMVYPAKVCNHCSEVHIGPSGHKARLCGMFKHEGWRGIHMWKRAEVNDLVPLKVVWHRRPQDPPVLVDNGRGFYGHAPAVVELCLQAGADVPKKYYCMMKVLGLAPQ